MKTNELICHIFIRRKTSISSSIIFRERFVLQNCLEYKKLKALRSTVCTYPVPKHDRFLIRELVRARHAI